MNSMKKLKFKNITGGWDFIRADHIAGFHRYYEPCGFLWRKKKLHWLVHLDTAAGYWPELEVGNKQNEKSFIDWKNNNE